MSLDNNNTEDPYWDFDKDKHFRPQLNKGDFFKLTGFDFGWFVLEPISQFVGDSDHEIERAKSLSYGQKTLYYWWYVDGQVTNGGFVQFYYNGYGPYVPTIIKSLEYIGDKKMAELIQRAENIYQKNKNLVDKAREKDLFGSDLYEQLGELSGLDSEYYKLKDKTMSKIEKYIRKKPNEICVDEDGKEFNKKFSGDCKTFYPNKQTKEAFSLENGIITGDLKSFYEDGTLKEKIQFLKGKQTGEREEFFENGKLKYSVKKDSVLNQLRHQWYYENENPEKLEHKQLDKDERIGEYKEWYNNGQLKETGTYISDYKKNGEWLEYYSDGSKKIEAEYNNGDFLLHNHWNEKGELTLKNGTGLYVRVYDESNENAPEVRIVEWEYKNYKRHGQQKTFINGILTEYQEFENGVGAGYARRYYRNGKIKEEQFYENGLPITTEFFPKSDNPIGKVTFKYIMKEEWLKNEGLPPVDTYPVCLNEEEIKSIIEIPKSLFEPQHQDLEGSTCLWLYVDDQGNVTNTDFRSSYMTRGSEFMEVANKMKFKPATKDGKNIASCIYIIAHFAIE
jgi:antitoxin component YwqK of YwqJK toxin-antitoxin module